MALRSISLRIFFTRFTAAITGVCRDTYTHFGTCAPAWMSAIGAWLIGRRCTVVPGGRRCMSWFFFSWRSERSSAWMENGGEVVTSEGGGGGCGCALGGEGAVVLGTAMICFSDNRFQRGCFEEWQGRGRAGFRWRMLVLLEEDSHVVVFRSTCVSLRRYRQKFSSLVPNSVRMHVIVKMDRPILCTVLKFTCSLKPQVVFDTQISHWVIRALSAIYTAKLTSKMTPSYLRYIHIYCTTHILALGA